jgi:hypothetical protein
VVQVIEANEATRMMPVHDGENSVMCHVTPAGFNHYRAGLDREGALGYGIGDSQGGQATTGAPPRPTLNRLAASASFISIDEWSWSMTIMWAINGVFISPTTCPNRTRHLRRLGSISRCSAPLSDHLNYRLPPLGTWPSASGTSIYIGIPTGADTRPEDVADTLWEAAIFQLTTLENEKDVARNR